MTWADGNEPENRVLGIAAWEIEAFCGWDYDLDSEGRVVNNGVYTKRYSWAYIREYVNGTMVRIFLRNIPTLRLARKAQ